MFKIKVLIIPAWYPSEENPIAGIFFKEQAEALNKYIDVAVLSLNRLSLKNPKNIFKKKIDKIENDEVLTFRGNYINWFPKLYCLSDKLYKKNLIKSYKKLANQFNEPDIIHAHVSYPAGYGALLLKEKFNIPFMVTEHASFFDSHILKYHKKTTKKVLENADKYTAVSSFLKEKIKKAGRAQCDVVPNFINYNKFNAIESEIKFQNKKFNLLHVSLMSEIKNIPVLLVSLKKLVFEYDYTKLHLHIVGDGKNKEKYISKAKALDIYNYVTFHGMVDNNKVAEFMKKSNALVISSKSETFGVVGIEAMASGIPVISTKCGGPEDYINSDTGILVKEGNVDSLSQGIMEMIDNYKNYNSDLIKNHIKNNFSEEVVSKKLINIYKNILSNYKK